MPITLEPRGLVPHRLVESPMPTTSEVFAIFYSLPRGDTCSDLYLAYQRCTYSTAAIALGCRVLDGGVVCEAEREASDACQ